MAQQTSGYEYPEQSYYPRWKIRLILRFCEFGLFQPLQMKAPAKPTRSLSGVDMARGGLTAVPDPTSPPGATRFLLQSGSASVFSPQAQQTSSDGFTHVLEGIVPDEFHWSQNGLRTASALTCEFPFINCPIDPRTLRSCAIEFYLGTLSASAAMTQAAGGAGGAEADGSYNIGAEPLDLIPETYTDANGQPRTNLRFQGWVDEWEAAWSSSSLSKVRLNCTDNTRLLLNMHAPSKGQVSKDLPLDEAIAKYMTFSPTFQGLTVEYRPSNEKAPKLADVLHSSAFLPGQGPPISKVHEHETPTVLDYLTDITRSVGLSLYMDGTTLVIQRVRTLTSTNIQGRPDDPYQPRTLPSGLVLPRRRMLYGRNVDELKIKHHLNEKKPANISIRAYDPDHKKVLVERFPLKADEQIYALPGEGTAEVKWLELTMPGGVVDPVTMRAYAQQVYESLWRQELIVEIKTINFASFGGGNSDPDLLDLKFGDAVEVLFSRDDYYSTLGPLQGKLDAVGANSDLLQAAGFPKVFADAYAKAYTDAGLVQVYRTHQVDVSGSITEGVALELRCVNYIEVTSDKSLAPGEEPPQATPSRNSPPAGSPPPPDRPPALSF